MMLFATMPLWLSKMNTRNYAIRYTSCSRLWSTVPLVVLPEFKCIYNTHIIYNTIIYNLIYITPDIFDWTTVEDGVMYYTTTYFGILVWLLLSNQDPRLLDRQTDRQTSLLR
jgi:hypothetical protein